MANRRFRQFQLEPPRRNIGINEDEILQNPTEFYLNNNTKMPSLAVDITQPLSNYIVKDIVDRALYEGYRQFDTSPQYGNEYRLIGALKNLLPKYRLKRGDVFITSKLNPQDFGSKARIESSFFRSKYNMGSEYIDLYLVNNPGTSRLALNRSANNRFLENTWSKLVQKYDDGEVTALGVANFNITMLEELSKCDYGVTPAVNSVEWHPYYTEKHLYSYCKKHEILIQACSTMDCSNGVRMFQDPFITNLTRKLQIAPSELIIGWTLQQGVALIPRSISVHNTYIDTIPQQLKISRRDMMVLDTFAESNSQVIVM